MALNKMIGLLITEIPNILKFCKFENLVSLQVIDEINIWIINSNIN